MTRTLNGGLAKLYDMPRQSPPFQAPKSGLLSEETVAEVIVDAAQGLWIGRLPGRANDDGCTRPRSGNAVRVRQTSR